MLTLDNYLLLYGSDDGSGGRVNGGGGDVSDGRVGDGSGGVGGGRVDGSNRDCGGSGRVSGDGGSGNGSGSSCGWLLLLFIIVNILFYCSGYIILL